MDIEEEIGIEGPIQSEAVVEKKSASIRGERPPGIDDPEEDESSNPVDFSPYIAQLAPSTLKILEDDFHAHFIHLIHPRKPKSS